MLCENCKQNEATIYVSEVINGQMTEQYLCDTCVKKSEKTMETQAILFNNFISELMKIALEEGYIKSPNPPAEKRCTQCGLSLKEFLEIGRFGCKECYTTFNNELKNAFINVHGNTKHVGKEGPDKTTEVNHGESKEEKVKKLEEALQKAIKDEAYEDAAHLRDTIRAIKNGGED